ncbi:MAG: DUF2855 family protein [Alphaproteobacteria bacterium]
MTNQTLLVNRTDFGDVTLFKSEDGALKDGHIRVDIGPFALTANNVTYMVTGDMIGYWKYFAPEAYGIDEAGTGRMPVWGYGIVKETLCDSLEVGDRIYGFFPVAKSMDMKPVKLNPMGFQDGTDHRVDLHSIYNSYTITKNDPSFAPALDDIQPILRPLFTTSFLIDDLFGEENFFGADQIILISASSKTAMGTAYCLKERGGVKVTGLTSSGNKDFVEKTGFYDDVTTYDAIDGLDGSVKTAIIDMAGNGKVTGALYEKFGDNIVYNCMVGKSHWQGGSPPKPSKGAPPSMFFAPDRAKQRFADWGPAGFASNLAARWLPFCHGAKDWLEIYHGEGLEAFLPVYKDLLEGRANPARGYLLSL